MHLENPKLKRQVLLV